MSRDRALHVRNATPEIEAKIDRDLFVARASGMEPSARVADSGDELAFDKAVDILVAGCVEH